MNCFNHNDRAAVGICKSCGKGLCRECATELQDGLACKGVCEPRVKLMGRIVDNNSRVLFATRAQTRLGGIMTIVLGVLFVILALWSGVRGEDMFSVAMFGLPGFAFLAYGVVRLSRKSQYPDPADQTAGGTEK